MSATHVHMYKYKYCWQGLYTIHTPVHTLYMVAHHHNKTIKTTDTLSLSLSLSLRAAVPVLSPYLLGRSIEHDITDYYNRFRFSLELGHSESKPYLIILTGIKEETVKSYI